MSTATLSPSASVIVADFFVMLSQAVGTRLDGIVGYSFLRNYKVAFDYPNATLTLSPA